jgi:YhcH/YjgK/YiaL family protein
VIVDHLNHWKNYFAHPIWETVFGELLLLDENTPQMEKKIRGDDIVLKVVSYTTVDPRSEQAEPESHRRYLDIHTSIIHAERIDWFPAASLTVAKPYNDIEDAVCYAKPPSGGTGIVMLPGIFALFGPGDAHMPGLFASGCPEVGKKAVMKIRIDMPF